MINLHIPLAAEVFRQFGDQNRVEPTAELINPFDACKAFDSELGTKTVSILHKYIKLDSSIQDLPFQLDADRDSSAWPGPDPTRPSYLTLNPVKKYYQETVDLGIVAKRFSDRLRQLTDPVSGQVDHLRVAQRISAHEIGHFIDFHLLKRAFDGDQATAYTAYQSLRARDLAVLPLAAPTSLAIQHWANNINGYRDLVSAHYRVESQSDWDELCRLNIVAYPGIASERVADRYADIVLLAAGLERP